MRKENIKLLTATLLMCIIVTMKCRAENQTGSISISPASPTGHWSTTNALKQDESASLQIIVASGGRVGNVDYVLETVNYPDLPQEDDFMWYGSGGSYAICNTKGESAHATVTVTCLWVPKPGEGGGGAGTRPPDIPGTATGIAHAQPSIYWNEADEDVKAVGNAENAITVRAWKNDDQPADSTWENPGGGAQITGNGASVSVFGTSASPSVGGTVVKSTCIACDKSDKEFLTFVAVTEIEAEPEIVCVDGDVSYKITTQPEGFNHMVSYTPANTSVADVHEVIAWCGSSSATTTVTVIKIFLEQTDDNAPLVPSNRMCSNAQDEYKTVEYKIRMMPAEGYTVKATITGTAGVTFDDGTTTKTGLADETLVVLKTPDDVTGTWKLAAECEQHPCCKDQAEEEVFRFIGVNPIYGNRNISESAQVLPNAILTDNSTDNNYDFETKSRISGEEAMITTRIHGNFGVKTSPAGRYSGDVNATLKASLTATVWADDNCVSYMYFRIVDKDGNAWKKFFSTGGTKEDVASFKSGATDWMINPSPAPPDKPWSGDSAHSCAQSASLFWHSSGVRIEPLDIEIKNFELPKP